jgi:hypothetical protein
MDIYQVPSRQQHDRWAVVALRIVAVCAGVATLMGDQTRLPGAQSMERKCTLGEPLNPRVPPQLALFPSDIKVFVNSPRLATTVDACGALGVKPEVCDPGAFGFEVSGEINADPKRWHIEVDTLRTADLNPQEEANWDIVATISIDGQGSRPNQFKFSSKVTPFFDLPGAWQQGGLGRFRMLAVITNPKNPDDTSQCAFLPVADSDNNFPLDPTTIVVADSGVDPTKPLGETESTIRDRFNTKTPNYLSANRQRIPQWLFPTTREDEANQLDLQKETTTKYYQAISTGAVFLGPTIENRLSTLTAFRDRYFGSFDQCVRDSDDETMRDEPEQVATYFNKGDLGIGREMHCIYRGCTAELACYVRNFAGSVNICRQVPNAPPNTPPICKDELIFDNKEETAKVLNDAPFATVAMVERGKLFNFTGLTDAPLAVAPNSVFFVVYDKDDNLKKDAAQLDNKGYNTSIPGNCLQCHGINSRYVVSPAGSFRATRFRRHEVTNAMFLPFDLNAFEFFSDDPSDPLSRAAQEGAFRAFNRMVLRSALGRSAAARDLIKAWYAGDLTDESNHPYKGFSPRGWEGSPSQLYLKFVAVGCRSCHISWVDPKTLEPGPRTFSTFDDFRNFAPRIKTIVCGHADPDTNPAKDAHAMPAAEQTLKVLWRSEGRQHFFAQLPGQFGECGP